MKTADYSLKILNTEKCNVIDNIVRFTLIHSYEPTLLSAILLDQVFNIKRLISH